MIQINYNPSPPILKCRLFYFFELDFAVSAGGNLPENEEYLLSGDKERKSYRSDCQNPQKYLFHNNLSLKIIIFPLSIFLSPL